MFDSPLFVTILIAAITGVASAAFFLFWASRNKINPQPSVSPSPVNARLHSLIDATVGTTAEPFFYALVRELAYYLSIDTVLIAAIDKDEDQFKSLAIWREGGYQMNRLISLQSQGDANSTGFWFIEHSAHKQFVDAEHLQQPYKAEGYFVHKLQDSSGATIGLIAGISNTAFAPQREQTDVIKLFSSRAASELERLISVHQTLNEKNRAQITMHSIGDGLITTDVDGCIDYMNPVAERLSGWRFHQAMGLSISSVLHLEDEMTGEVIPDPALHCLQEQRVISPKTENVLIDRSGQRHSIQGTAAPMLDAQGRIIGVVLVVKDVTDSRRREKKMVHQATHDSLTGLVNRLEFEKRLDKAINSAKEYDNNHALLYLDLDQFKQVNDSAGHVAGDELLVQISALLSGLLRGRDTLGRLGGDEFAVLLANCPMTKAQRVAEVLIEMVRDYRFIWENKTFKVGVSIGIVAIDAQSANRDMLMQFADNACYAAKDLGRSCYCIFKPKQSEPLDPLEHGQKLQRDDLENAIEKEKFELLYQPIVALDIEQTLMHTRAEVLLRMLDQNNRYLSPGAFLPAALRFGLIGQIDRWVVQQVTSSFPHIFMQNPDLVLSVNISDHSIADDSFTDFLVTSINQSIVESHQLCIEISETSLTNNRLAATQMIERLHETGCFIALDDFGSGLSSFGFIKELPLDFIKIDGSLIRDIATDPIDLEMVISINNMCHLLDIKTIAECADSEVIIDKLKDIGVDYAQGYYLGNPDPMENLTTPSKLTVMKSAVNIN